MADIELINKKLQEGLPLTDEESLVLGTQSQDMSLPQPEQLSNTESMRRVIKDLAPQPDSFNDVESLGLPNSTENILPGLKEPTIPPIKEVALPIVKQAIPQQKEVVPPNLPVQPKLPQAAPLPIQPSLDRGDEELKEAQKQASLNRFMANLGRAGAQLGTGIAGADFTPEHAAQFKSLEEQAGQPVTDLLQRRKSQTEKLDQQKKIYDLATEQEKTDPKSDVSLMIQGVLKKMMPELKVENMSASSIEKVLPSVEKYFAAKDAREARNALIDANRSAKEEKTLDTDFRKFGEAMTLSRLSGQAVQQAKAKLFAAERLEGLIKQFPDGNIPPIQTRELATSLGALLSPGAGSGTAVSQINELVPHTASGSAAKIAEWFTSNPTGSRQQAFIKLYTETVEREKDIAKNQIKQAKLEKAGSYRDLLKKDPARFEQLLIEHDINAEDFEKFGKGKKLDITGGYGKFKDEEKSTVVDKKQQSDSAEIRRKTKDGKVAIFDEKTKQFLRYE